MLSRTPNNSLSGCCSQGATKEEALVNVREAITEYLAAKAEEICGDASVRSVLRAEVMI